MHVVTQCIVIVVLVGYVVLGGVGFHFLESRNEDEARLEVTQAQGDFLANYSCVSREDLERVIKAVVKAYDSGVLVVDNQTSASNWDFYSSIFFSTTVVTTIGYGHISPETRGGRIFCAVFALFGIPLFLVITSSLAVGYKNLMKRCGKKMLCNSNNRRCKLIVYILIFLFNVCLYLVIPAVIFTFVESGWSYSESFYYVFVTLTTIGFGDFVAGQDSDESYRGWYKLMVSVWILLGLMWVGYLIAQVQEIMENYFARKEEEREAGNRRETPFTLKAPPPGRNHFNQIENGTAIHPPASPSRGIENSSYHCTQL